tara:strand:- start:8456 stop:9283 length:828 start_codon:yes stop_codon:yes gene_type:complete
MQNSPIYLIPFDFTPVSESAMRLGLDLAIANKGSVMLLHVAKKHSEKRDVKKQFKQVIADLSESDANLVVTRVLVGDIFEDITKAAEIIDAALIVMGTHGARGFQKIFGSNAVKMISHSSTPLMITQGKKTVDKINAIVMPFSFEKKTIQIINLATSIAKKFNATIHLVGYHDKDEWLKKNMKNNQKIIRRHLQENNVEHVIENIAAGSDYNSELMKYAQKVDADLMAAGYYQDGIITNPNSFIQSMIENKLHLPLLTVNAEELNVQTGSAGTGF